MGIAPRAGHAGGFSLIEVVVVIAVISAMVVGTTVMVSRQIGFFAVRADAQDLLQTLRAEQGKALRTGHPGWVKFFRGRIERNPAGVPLFLIESRGHCFLISPGVATRATVDASETPPAVATLATLSDADRARIVNLDRGTIVRHATGVEFTGGELVQFANIETIAVTDPRNIVRRGNLTGIPRITDVVLKHSTFERPFQIRIDEGGFVTLILGAPE